MANLPVIFPFVAATQKRNGSSLEILNEKNFIRIYLILAFCSDCNFEDKIK